MSHIMNGKRRTKDKCIQLYDILMLKYTIHFNTDTCIKHMEKMIEFSPPNLRGTGKTKHVFICYSNKDEQFARESVITPLQRKGFKTCNYQDDFIAGLTVFENITMAIRESLKYVLIITENFNESHWCDYESQLTLSLSIDMKASNVVIPLVKDETKIPDFLQLFIPLYVSNDHNSWQEKLFEAVESKIEFRDMIKSKPLDQELNVISIAYLENVEERKEKLEKIVKDHSKEIKLDPRLKSNGGEYMMYDAKRKSPSIQECHHFSGPFAQQSRTETKEICTMCIVESFLDMINNNVHILIWLSKAFEKDNMCKNLRRMVCFLTMDKNRKKAPWVIPLCLDENTDIPNDLNFSCLFGQWYERLCDLLYRNDLSYRNRMPLLKFRSGEDLFRIAEFEGKINEYEVSPRILGITFVDNGHILLLDADNKKIKKCTLFGDVLDHISLGVRRPNRISRIDNTQVAIIYEDDIKILLLDTQNFGEKSFTPSLKKDELIKGITAMSLSEIFIATNGGIDHPRLIKIDVEQANPQTLCSCDKVKDNDYFNMPRRMTKNPDNSKVIIADENDRRLVVLDREGRLINAQDKWNKRLYNVRGLAASNDTIFIAACNGITTADINTLEIAETPLIKFPSDVYHTRAVALDPDGKFLAISQAVENKEIVRIFSMTKHLDMSSVKDDLVSKQQTSSNAVIQFFLNIIYIFVNLCDYIE